MTGVARGQRARLAYVVHNLNPGGTERLAVEMALEFANEFDVRMYCLDEPGIWARKLRSNGIPVHSLRRQPGLDLSVVVDLARHFREADIELVHAHQCTPWFYAALSRMIFRKPQLLLVEHGRFFPEEDNVKKRFVNRVLVRRLTHRFVAVSKDVRQRLIRYEGIPSVERIDVIYNGAGDIPTLPVQSRAELRRSLGLAEQDFVVGTVGRFDPIKNLGMLVDSIGRTRRHSDRVRGLLIGDGPLFEEVRGLVATAGLNDVIRLPGFREDARELVQCIDLFVLSSFSEGTSMALLEAMAAGVPVAVTDVGGNPEVVEREQSGWVVPSGSVEQLTGAILDAVGDPDKASAYARAGRARFDSQFSFAGMMDRYRRLYAGMLNESGRAAWSAG